MTFLERTFQLDAHRTTVRTEVLAGFTTFLTMAYIVLVNPSILSTTGMPAMSAASGASPTWSKPLPADRLFPRKYPRCVSMRRSAECRVG
ncbi:MAG: hypothetical protein OEX15_03175 [Gammaproteobacteria bacterium]|nr:hypothetical protein [Gammaproteobacteria bacterium]